MSSLCIFPEVGNGRKHAELDQTVVSSSTAFFTLSAAWSPMRSWAACQGANLHEKHPADFPCILPGQFTRIGRTSRKTVNLAVPSRTLENKYLYTLPSTFVMS